MSIKLSMVQFGLKFQVWFEITTQSYNTTHNGKISAQPHTIVKQICFPNGNLLFLSLFSLSKNWMHNVVWGCAEILPTLHKFPKVLSSKYKISGGKKIFQRSITKLICKTSCTLSNFPFIANDIERANTLLKRIYAKLNNKHVRIILTWQPHGYGNTAKRN